MPAQTTTSVIRSLLTADINMLPDEVVRRARARGVTSPDKPLKKLIRNLRSEMKKQLAAQPVPAAAQVTNGPQPAAPTDLTRVFANVTLVNSLIGVVGGLDQARQAAEAVRACGGVDAFLQHLELLGGIRGASA